MIETNYDRKKISYKSIVVLHFFCIGTFILFMLSRKIFPMNFFFDNKTVRIFMENPGINDDKSYLNTANLFSFFGFEYNSSFISEQIFSWLIFILLISILIIKFHLNISTVQNFILLSLFTVFYSAYVTQLSKELVLIILMVGILLIINKKNEKVMLLLSALLYAYFFRTYWFLTIFFTISFLITLRFTNTKMNKKFFALIGIQVIIIQLLFLGVTKDYLTNARYNVNQTRLSSEFADTMISNPFINTSILTDFFNFCYGLMNLFIPIDGLGSANEIVYYIFIWFVISILKKMYKSRKPDFYKYSAYYMFLVSFIVVQAFFEPDMGSALRHQVILIPIILFISCKVKPQNDIY